MKILKLEIVLKVKILIFLKNLINQKEIKRNKTKSTAVPLSAMTFSFAKNK